MAMLNSEYTQVLKNILQNVNRNKYIVLGSAATLSFTSKIGYSRKMNDLDIIIDSSLVGKIKERLSNDGYYASTFINKRMPLYRKLSKYKNSIYLRYSKQDINVEILSTEFIEENGFLKFDLYPDFWVKIPINSLVVSSLEGSRFTTLDVNLLWAIKQILGNTLGRIMVHKGNQRNADLKELKKVVDLTKAKRLLSAGKFGYKNISLKAPLFFLGY